MPTNFIYRTRLVNASNDVLLERKSLRSKTARDWERIFDDVASYSDQRGYSRGRLHTTIEKVMLKPSRRSVRRKRKTCQ